MKEYNGEKAVISMTSWKARIRGVPKVIFNILQKCPGFHFVLVLSEEEFPKKKEELPADLRLMIDGGAIEIIWVKKNYKSFKKVVYTAEKYKEVPVISADDDCVYNYNYAEELYNEWCKHKDCLISECTTVGRYMTNVWGFATIHPPHSYNFEFAEKIFDYCSKRNCFHDDMFYSYYFKLKGKKILSLHKRRQHVAGYVNGQCSLEGSRRLNKVNDGAVIVSAFNAYKNDFEL